MNNSKVIAEQALTEACDIISRKRRIYRLFKTVAAATLVTCVAVSYTAFKEQSEIFMTDGLRVPLGNMAIVQDVDAAPYAGDDTVYTIPGIDCISIPVGAMDAQVTLFNPGSNVCSFLFEIILEETGESLYRSGLVPPSMCVEDVTFSRALVEGRHKAVLIIHAYDANNVYYNAAVASVMIDIIAV